MRCSLSPQELADTALQRRPHGSHSIRRISFEPWWGQRLVLRSTAGCRVLVAARQVGKSYLAVHLTLEIALAEPGSFSVLLAPTYLIARTAIDTMEATCREIPGCRWREQQKRMVFPNGSIWQVFSADRKETVRGPALTGLLWVDEAAFLSAKAWTAALGTLSAAKSPRKLLTTTPMGKNWVFDEFVSTDPENESFRFRSQDSPHINQAEVARNRAKMSPERAAQEFDAEFVDSLILAFPDLDGLFVGRFPDRRGQARPRSCLGIDLGKDQDWTVVVHMNEFGEAEVLGRWQHLSWPETETKVLDFLAERAVDLVVVDKAYVGGYLIDRLRVLGHRVLGIATSAASLKARIVETCRADVQHGRLRVLEGTHTDQLRHELKRFQGSRSVQNGQVHVRYENPELKGEHDDCVIALCLTNWGRTQELDQVKPRLRIDLRKCLDSARRWHRPGSSPGRRAP